VKINDLMSYHNCKNRKELSQKIGYSTVTLWKWEKLGIPLTTQAVLQIKTNGKLKADHQALVA
jgi:hypothetical protein